MSEIKMNIQELAISEKLQQRTEMNQQIINEYAEVMTNEGAEVFPAIKALCVDSLYYIVDGFHRYHAMLKAGIQEIYVNVIGSGSMRDAILYTVGANAAHGLNRTPADKRKAVITLLQDNEWNKWSDREIARRCKVSNTFVSNIRNEVTVNVYSEKTYIDKHGQTTKMNIGNIGSSKPKKTPFDKITAAIEKVADEITKEQINALIKQLTEMRMKVPQVEQMEITDDPYINETGEVSEEEYQDILRRIELGIDTERHWGRKIIYNSQHIKHENIEEFSFDEPE